MNKQRLYILVISVIGMLAAFMPWLSATALRSITRNFDGVMGDGKITLALFAVACALCFVGNKQEKFEKNFVYGLWAIGGINIIVFIVLLINANKATSAVAGFGSLSVSHGAYLTFLAAVGLIVFSVEQLQLVNKVDGMISNKKNVVSNKPTEQVVPVKEAIAPVQESVSEMESAQEKTELVVEEVQEVVAQVQEEAEQVVEEVKEVVTETTEEKTSESEKA